MKFIAQTEFAQLLYTNLKEAYIRPSPITDEETKAALVATINKLINGVTSAPIGANVAAQVLEHEPGNALPAVTAFLHGQAAESISIVMLGEDHSSEQDKLRANDFIKAISSDHLILNLVVFERDMEKKYPTPKEVTVVREDGLTTAKEMAGAAKFGLELSKAQRSMVIAAYLVLLTGGGNQKSTDKILLFYGENHTDIFTYFEFFAQHSLAGHLQKRGRTSCLVISYVP